MKLKAKRGLLLAVCAAAIVPLAAIPLGWFALTDATLVGQRQDQETPYTSLVPTGDDYYLLRQLNTRVELARRPKRAWQVRFIPRKKGCRECICPALPTPRIWPMPIRPWSSTGTNCCGPWWTGACCPRHGWSR